MGILKSLVGETAIYGLGTIIPRLLNYVLLTPFFTRIFNKGEYGSLTELYAYVAFLLVFLTYGMETTFFRFYESENKKERVYSTIMWSMFITTSIFLFIIVFFYPHIAQLIDYKNHTNFILWLGIIVGTDAFFAVPFAKLRQENKAVRFTIIKLTNITVNLLLIYFILYLCKTESEINPNSFLGKIYNPEIGVGYVLLANLVSSLVVAIMLIPQLLEIKRIFDLQLLKKILHYTWPLLVVGSAAMVNEVGDKIILKYVISPENHPMEQVGIYGAAYKLAVLMTIFIQMFKYAAEPFFFKQAKEKNAQKTYAFVMKYFIIFGIIIFLGITLFMDLIKYYIGANFWEGLKIVPIILIANLFLGIYYNLSIWYKLTNKTILGAAISIIGAIITLVINFSLIPIYGYMASAWATLAAYGSMMLISWAWGKKYYPIQYPIKSILLYFFAGLGIYFLSQQIQIENFWIKNITSGFLLIGFISISYFIERKQLKTTAF